MSNPKLINFTIHTDDRGQLSAYESEKTVPFNILRVFTSIAKKNEVRGEHAHKKCTQLLVCTHGQLRVTCDDGENVTEYILDNMGVSLLVPPEVWCKQEYLEDNTVLMVLCDRLYEADDYLHEYDEFVDFIK